MFNLGLIYHFGSRSSLFEKIKLKERAAPPAEQVGASTDDGWASSPPNQEAEEGKNIIQIDLNQAQKFYQLALKEESRAQAPVYLLYLYSKWQSVDLYESIIKELLMNSILKSPGNQLMMLLGAAAYLSLLWGTVRYLRKDLIER